VTEEGYIRSKPASRNISDPMQAQLSEAEREVLAGLVECHPQPEPILLQAPLEICRAQLLARKSAQPSSLRLNIVIVIVESST
jgi:hypothetical protein